MSAPICQCCGAPWRTLGHQRGPLCGCERGSVAWYCGGCLHCKLHCECAEQVLFTSWYDASTYRIKSKLSAQEVGGGGA